MLKSMTPHSNKCDIYLVGYVVCFSSWLHSLYLSELIHWGWVTHMRQWIMPRTIGSDNDLAIIWTSVGMLLLTEPMGTNFNEIWTKIQQFSFGEIYLTMSSAKCSHLVLIVCKMAVILSRPQWVNISWVFHAVIFMWTSTLLYLLLLLKISILYSLLLSSVEAVSFK